MLVLYLQSIRFIYLVNFCLFVKQLLVTQAATKRGSLQTAILLKIKSFTGIF